MVKFNVLINSINDVKDFVNTVNRYSFDIDLISGRYIVDAKSIMGIFSLDLSQVIEVNAYTDDEQIIEDLKPFIVA